MAVAGRHPGPGELRLQRRNHLVGVGKRLIDPDVCRDRLILIVAQALTETTMFRNATLQGAYLIMAARALGLDCGPMSGFNNSMVDDLFLSERGWKSNFLIALGKGDPSVLKPRPPRFDFDDVCVLI